MRTLRVVFFIHGLITVAAGIPKGYRWNELEVWL